MQPVDLTTLRAVCADLQHWLPARLETVYQRDRHTIALALRTLKKQDWLTLSWHPQAARIAFEPPPPRQPDTFTFSQQLHAQLNRLALVRVGLVNPWERVVVLEFAPRPQEATQWRLYAEIMGKYSNVILVNAAGEIVTAAHQVNAQQSRLRPILTGQPYVPPPPLTAALPSCEIPFEQWQQQVSVIPGLLRQQLLKAYRGLSPALVQQLLADAALPLESRTTELTAEEWRRLFDHWQHWLACLESGHFVPQFTSTGYRVIPPLGTQTPSTLSIHEILATYYQNQLQQQQTQQLQQQLHQSLQAQRQKLIAKIEGFRERLAAAAGGDRQRYLADLLMAHAHLWQPGMTELIVTDFATQEPLAIPLSPEKSAIQTAQELYKQQQKLKRAQQHITPLLTAAEGELAYLDQVAATLTTATSLDVLEEIRAELIQQGYLTAPDYYRPPTTPSPYLRYTTPSGFTVLVGRNNRQNDDLTFRVASPYDWWFHTQEIPGSHVILRLAAGEVPSEKDIQYVANLAAYHSQARASAQVPVVYTRRKYVQKPKGANPGMVIYDQATVVWGCPLSVSDGSSDLTQGGAGGDRDGIMAE
ncbi:NFACT family protein [Thermosynechococcus sp. B0]|uniref:Rqc2 family fibronectin-binding protein n=1 Tax=unclassified Thermosynechococcus TaxID=2622553 RepID=UPI002576A255|nr:MULTISPECIES: NFACT RNA binding domain-containing protein [unclassified Thermosynechococcus]WJI25078.1 NFACT family protein [Thermosynechococcus sp. B0]WJI27606.1 NFACT family protein [Thermosynechococcus sp. B1]